MNHISATRGHWIVAIGAIVVVGATFMQWWQIGGGAGELSRTTGLGISDGRVFLMFLASVASLFLVTLPFASEKPIPIDHPLAYFALLGAVVVGYAWRTYSLIQSQLVPWPPQLGIGFWLSAVGIVLYARGVFEVFEERRRRLY